MKEKDKNTALPKIKVLPEIIPLLSEEFNTSETTVYNALKFFTFSKIARKIRERAMELMEEIRNSNISVMNTFHKKH